MKSLKKLKIEHVVLFVIGALFIMFLVNSYNGSKNSTSEQMSSARMQQESYSKMQQ